MMWLKKKKKRKVIKKKIDIILMDKKGDLVSDKFSLKDLSKKRAEELIKKIEIDMRKKDILLKFDNGFIVKEKVVGVLVK